MLEGVKGPPMLIYKGASEPVDGAPRQGSKSIANELLDGKQNGVKYPTSTILAFNPKAYEYELSWFIH
jgi:hypothetical protein